MTVLRLVLVLAMACLQLACKPEAQQAKNLQQTLDPSILATQLDNGFKYYLRSANSASGNEQIEIRLVVKAGSLHETDSQRGYAHLLEHMAYRGTSNFGEQDIEGLLSGAGLRWGVDVNATTHYGATVYRFSLHQDDAELLPQLFSLMSGWLSDIQFDPIALEREKRIVEAEWHDRFAKRQYVVEPLTELALSGSRYDSKPPAGSLSSIRNATSESLTRFWKANYRPDNAMLVVTGSKEPWRLETLITHYFNAVDQENSADIDQAMPEVSKSSLVAKNYTHRVYKNAEFVSYTNPELQLPELSINFIPPVLISPAETSPEISIAGEFKEQLLFTAYSHLLTNRLLKTAQCNSLQAESTALDSGQFIEHIKITLAQDDFTDCLSVAEDAVKSFNSMNLTDEEYNKFQRLFKDLAQDTIAKYRNRTADDLADDLVDMVIHQELLVSVWDLQAELDAVVDSIDRASLNAMIKSVSDSYRLVYAAVGNDSNIPSVEDMYAASSDGKSKFVAREAPRLVGGSYKTEQENYLVPELAIDKASVDKIAEGNGYHQWRLQNGSTAILIEDHSADQVAVAAVAHGGYAEGDPLRSMAAKHLPQFIAVNGVNGFVRNSLKLIERERQVAVDPFVDPYSHGVYGNSRTDELPLLLTLVEAYFKDPMIVEPNSISFVQRLSELKSDDWHGAGWDNPHQIQSVSNSRGLSIESFKSAHIELFQSPADFDFVFYGSVSPTDLQRELQRLSYGVKTAARQKTTTTKNLLAIKQGSNTADLAFYIACPINEDTAAARYRQWMLLSDILSNRLRFSVREVHGLAYEIESAQYVVNKNRSEKQLLNLTQFVVAPEDANEAAAVAKQVLADIHDKGITESELQWALARNKRDKHQRTRGFVHMVSDMADEWLATGYVGLEPLGASDIGAINKLAQCIEMSGEKTVVLNSTVDERSEDQSSLYVEPNARHAD